MSAVRVVGVDPGPVPGIVVLDVQAGALLGAEVIQCTAGVAPRLVESLVRGWPSVVAVEKFVVGPRSGRSSSAAAGARTRDLVGELRHVADSEVARGGGVTFLDRPAAQVKPWATDARLAACRVGRQRGLDLIDLTKGMRHSRDAARHGLYAAVRDAGLTDPLSRRAS